MLAMYTSKDKTVETVQTAILHVQDLHGADALYHKSCSVNFMTRRHEPTAFESDKAEVKRARLWGQTVEEKTLPLLEVARFLEENEDKQITTTDLIIKKHGIGSIWSREPLMISQTATFT